jgi:hypothetical protein
MAAYADSLTKRLKKKQGPEAPRTLSDEDKGNLVKEVREAIEESWNFERDNRREAALDLRFMAGDQWPEQIRMARQAANRPTPTVNVLPQFVRQVTNDIRQADLAVKVAPVDDQSDPKLAKIYNGLLRQIHYRSSAKAVYSAGSENQAACGIGWWRVISDYVDETAFDQELKVVKILNPLSVYCDPGATLPDRSDGAWAALCEMIPRKTFEKRWPKAQAVSIDISKDVSPDGFFWATPDSIRVAEYYRKVPVKKTFALLENGQVVDITGKGEAELGLFPIVQTREAFQTKVEHYIVSGSDVLEGPNDWPGRYIPLIPVIGAEIPLETMTYRHGVIRFARDPQQLMNFYRAAATEAIALAPKAPFKVTAKQIGKYKDQWDTANTTNRPYLLYTPDPEAPGVAPMREAMSEVPAALIQQAETANDDIKRTTGIYDSSLGQRSNETSGRAIQARQIESDVANYHFADNFRASLEHTGRVLIDLIPKIYDNERVIRIIGEDEKEENVPINQVLMGVDGVPVMVNDLGAAVFDVRVSIGPSFSTKRAETMASLTEFVKSLPPELQAVSVDLIAKASDWPGAEQLSKRFKNMIQAANPAALADPDDPDAPKPPSPQEDPQYKLTMDKMMGEIEKLKASIAESYAKAENTQADTVKKLVESGVAGGMPQAVFKPAIVSPPQPQQPQLPGGPPPGPPPPGLQAPPGGPAGQPGPGGLPPEMLAQLAAAAGAPPGMPGAEGAPMPGGPMVGLPQMPPQIGQPDPEMMEEEERPSPPPPGFVGGSLSAF